MFEVLRKFYTTLIGLKIYTFFNLRLVLSQFNNFPTTTLRGEPQTTLLSVLEKLVHLR